MDGVLVDSHPAHRKAWRAFLSTLGKDLSDQELDFILDGRKRQEILRHFLGDATDQQIQEHGARKDEFFQRISLEVEPIPGAIEFISQLRRSGIPLAVATSASRSRTISTLNRMGLSQYFSVVVTGDDVMAGKPDPEIYKLACRKLKVNVATSVAVEDAVSGIHAAKSAGLRCIGVSGASPQEGLRSAGADKIIRDFAGLTVADLQPLLKQ